MINFFCDKKKKKKGSKRQTGHRNSGPIPPVWQTGQRKTQNEDIQQVSVSVVAEALSSVF
jgi:hypothetical protein